MLEKWVRFFRWLVSLRDGSDVNGTIQSINAGTSLRGAKSWLLVCATILASIGLDKNSSTVIIGAMLISPLMSPILGVGLGVAILDRKTFKAAIGSLAWATFVGLAASFLYFTVSPLSVMTTELSARTRPTILDVAVAFFGGIAGIVAGSRKDKTSAIPGVAIATALMPPLCTAGFGLATSDSAVFLGAFYLYFINAFFISLATYLIAIFLRFPKRARLDEETDVTVKGLIVAFSILIMIPSAIIFYEVLTTFRFERGVRNFVESEVRSDRQQPVSWEVLDSTQPRTLKVYTVGSHIGENDFARLRNAMNDYGIGNLELRIVEMNISREEYQRAASSMENSLTGKLRVLEGITEDRSQDLQVLKQELMLIKANSDPYVRFLNDVRKQFITVEEVAWQVVPLKSVTDLSSHDRTLVIKYIKDSKPELKRAARRGIAALAQKNFPNEEIAIVETQPEKSGPESKTLK